MDARIGPINCPRMQRSMTVENVNKTNAAIHSEAITVQTIHSAGTTVQTIHSTGIKVQTIHFAAIKVQPEVLKLKVFV